MDARQQLQNLQDFLVEGDEAEERKLEAIEAALGHPMHWPFPPRAIPRWYQFAAKRKLRAAEAWFGKLSQPDLDAFWSDVAKGQSVYEDAGGCLLRSFRAMLALPVDEPYTYKRAIADAIRPTA